MKSTFNKPKNDVNVEMQSKVESRFEDVLLDDLLSPESPKGNTAKKWHVLIEEESDYETNSENSEIIIQSFVKQFASESPEFHYTSDLSALEEMYIQLSGRLNLSESLQQKEVSLQETIPQAFPNTRKEIQQYAIDVLLEGIKAGDSKYFDLVKLLVNYDSEFAVEEQAVFNLVKINNSHQLQEQQRSILAFTIAQKLVIIAKEIIEGYKEEQTSEDADEFKTYFLNKFQTRSASMTRNLEEEISKYLVSKQNKHVESLAVIGLIRKFWPETRDHLEESFFNIQHVNDIPKFLQSIDNKINSYAELIPRARAIYVHYIDHATYKIKKAELVEKKNAYRDNLINRISATKNKIDMVGLPIKYRKQLTKEHLKTMAGSIETDYEDEEGRNLTLLAIWYQNKDIYLFFKNRREINCQIKDHIGRYASLYEEATLHRDPQTVNSARQMIKTIDDSSSLYELLIDMRIKLLRYMESWEIRDKEYESRRHLWKYNIRLFFLNLFKIEEDFRERKKESKLYLEITDEALKGKPLNFYDDMKKILRNSNRGAINGSKLHNMIEKFLNQINKNIDYHKLVDPSDILRKENELLREEMREREKRIKEEMKEQEKRFEERIAQLERGQAFSRHAEGNSSHSQSSSNFFQSSQSAHQKQGGKEGETHCHTTDNQNGKMY